MDFGPSPPLSPCRSPMLRATRADLSVMMPLDSVTMNNAVNRRRAMNVSLPALKWRVWCQKASPKWVAIQFFWVFFFHDWWLKEEVGMGLIWMVAEFYLCSFFLCEYGWIGSEEKKKSRLFSSCRRVLVGGCTGFGLVVGGWEREKQRDGDHRWREKTERFFILFYCVIYIILICRMKK